MVEVTVHENHKALCDLAKCYDNSKHVVVRENEKLGYATRSCCY